MSTITTYESLRMKGEIMRFQLAVRCHRLRLAGKFNDDQPRDERGRWTETGASSENDQDGERGPEPVLAAARRRKGVEEECKIQYEQDLFQCRMVGVPQCYHQALVRFNACERGRSIPPLNY